MMAAADTCMVLALVNHLKGFRPCTTVQLNTSFLKPLAAQDGIIEARVLRAGKSLAFGEIDIRGASDGKIGVPQQHHLCAVVVRQAQLP